jgi:hypothetical protein
VSKSGNSYSFGEEKLGRGYDASRTYLRENKKVANELVKEIRKGLNNAASATQASPSKDSASDEE